MKQKWFCSLLWHVYHTHSCLPLFMCAWIYGFWIMKMFSLKSQLFKTYNCHHQNTTRQTLLPKYVMPNRICWQYTTPWMSLWTDHYILLWTEYNILGTQWVTTLTHKGRGHLLTGVWKEGQLSITGLSGLLLLKPQTHSASKYTEQWAQYTNQAVLDVQICYAAHSCAGNTQRNSDSTAS
jgi:hypothetical protein